jgi:hypothetical protein
MPDQRPATLRQALLAAMLLGSAAACAGDSTAASGGKGDLSRFAGNGQSAVAGSALQPYQVLVSDALGAPLAGVAVGWKVVSGCGSVSAPSSTTNSSGIAQTTPTLGTLLGPQAVEASASGFGGSPLAFSSTATAAPSPAFTVLAGCDNVPERFTSDLWVAGGYLYTGTWGFRGTQGNAVKIWQLDAGGAPLLRDSIITPNVVTISDVQVSDDGQWLVFTSEGGTNPGLDVYQLTAPGHPVFRARQVIANGLHTGTLSVIGGKLYAFTAKDPVNCALQIYDLSAAGAGTITLASATPIPDNYCIHDTFVRDGYAFVLAWNSGVYIFDVGNGSSGGTPEAPVQIGQPHTFGGQTHNGWWFWNPSNGEKRYFFVGQEGPGSVGSSSSGDIHVVDVTDFANPVEVASYHLAGAGTHNFWVDEQRQILYAAYYNGGVVALDISGTLSGSLASREIARIRPGGPGNTYVWGVMLGANGSLYASDMVSGVWQLQVP